MGSKLLSPWLLCIFFLNSSNWSCSSTSYKKQEAESFRIPELEFSWTHIQTQTLQISFHSTTLALNLIPLRYHVNMQMQNGGYCVEREFKFPLKPKLFSPSQRKKKKKKHPETMDEIELPKPCQSLPFISPE